MTEERVAKSEVAQPLRLERASELTAHGESLASHRDGRGAPPARRDDREYREYLSEEQRSRRGCIARRMQPDFHHGLLALRRYRGDQRLDVAEGVRESLETVDALDLRHVVGHHHAVVADFLVDAHRLQHVHAAVVDERLAEVEEPSVDVAEMHAEDLLA